MEADYNIQSDNKEMECNPLSLSKLDSGWDADSVTAA